MFESLKQIFKQKELRSKLIYTLIVIVLFRLGCALTVPFLDPTALSTMVGSGSSDFLSYLNVLTGGALEDASIFGLSITPYINASIIIQLLTVAIPALERMAKEGNDGQKKIQKITRYLTLGLAVAMAIMYYFVLRNQKGVLEYYSGFAGVFSAIVIVASFVAGTMLVVWMGDQISEHGVGNGISIILFAGILSRGPSAFQTLVAWWKLGSEEPKYYFLVPLIVIVFAAMIAFIVFMTNAERRIPVSYAKRVVGRKMYGGQSTYIPIKVNMTGVLPIIFAMSFMSLPSMIESFVTPAQGGFWEKFFSLFHYNNVFYGVLYFLLILAFNYFYTAIQFNPVEIANSIRKNNGAIPGIRPGKPTVDYFSKVISKITLLGALFLGLIAVFPIIFSALTKANVSLGGTSILIVVGVALETVRSLESQITMRHHKGFLE